ncbi:hypothetical protein B7R22_00730 [Subtercola boreus]|uniref:Uncharacterized protein n=1 Tax=Subtercola boreus TaxID=120213 RepID=A0A3E0W5S5_9MICO|nr:hypothetical protein B7R22_00730 [Subtercola boreus]
MLIASSLVIVFRDGGDDGSHGVVIIAVLVVVGLAISFGVLTAMRAVSQIRGCRYQRSHPEAVVMGCRLADETKRSLALISESQLVRYESHFLTLVANDDGLRIVDGHAPTQEILHICWSQVVGSLQPSWISEQTTTSNGVLLPIRLPTHTEVLRIVLLSSGFPGIVPPSAKKTEELVRHLNARRDVVWRPPSPDKGNVRRRR